MKAHDEFGGIAGLEEDETLAEREARKSGRLVVASRCGHLAHEMCFEQILSGAA
jgi:hypothetical protein